MNFCGATKDALELLDACLEPLGRALVATMLPDGDLWDTERGDRTPPDHYGQLACALALRLLRPRAPEGRLAEQAWFRLSPAQLGHAPFNRFLLLLLERYDNEKRSVNRCPLKSRYPSNNWSLLAQLCRLLEAEGARAQRRADARLRGMLLGWMTDIGGFIDYPGKPARMGQVSTPLAYHHKALFVAAVAGGHSGDQRWVPILKKLFEWTLLSWDGEGSVGGFGRSNHALFGDACLLAALLLLGAAQSSECERPSGQMLSGVLKRLQGQVRQDGLLWLNPADAGAQAATGWDEYMYLSVYNAWTAAILAWARFVIATTQRPALVGQIKLPKATLVLQTDPAAGLVRLEAGADRCALLSTRGQPPQAFGRSEVECRYSGGLLFHLRARHYNLVPPPIRLPVNMLLAQPALAGWVPVFEAGAVLYGLTDFDAIDLQDTAAGLSVTAVGQPRALTRQNPRGLSGRLLAALDWRLLGGRLGRRHALQRPILTGITGRLRLVLGLERLQLFYRLELDNVQASTVRYLNPAGHALITDALPAHHRIMAPGQGSIDREPMETCQLPAALPSGQGYCLKSTTLARGCSSYGIELGWSLDGSN